MGIEGPRNPESAKTLIEAVEPIQESRNVPVLSREGIKDLVEAPLVSACQEFYDKNIRTLASSANVKDIRVGYGHIIIDYGTLSPENQEIAKQFGEPEEYDGMQTLIIKIPISAASTAADIEAESKRIAGSFKQQPATWVETRTLEDFKEIYGSPTLTIEDLAGWPPEEGGWYLDTASGLFYPSEELYRKAKNSA